MYVYEIQLTFLAQAKHDSDGFSFSMSASICKLEICSQKNIRIQVHTCSMMYFRNCYKYLIFDIPL